jgi:radical SAM protein with 4Fe4S-binding SPASM domain
MRCIFCLHGHHKVEHKVLDYETFCRIIDEGESYGLCSIKLNYINEPLLVKDLERYVAYARSRGVLNVYFAANGTLLTPSRSRSLIDAGVTRIMVSLDAFSAETFEEVRRSKRYDKIVENIHGLISIRDSLNRRNPLVRVNFLRTEQNQHEADDFLAYWESRVDMIGYQTLVNVPGISFSAEGATEAPEGFRCSFPFKLMVVDSAGDILPCCTFSGRSMPMGNVANMTVKQAWDSVKMTALRRTHKMGGYKSNPICAACVASGGGENVKSK